MQKYHTINVHKISLTSQDTFFEKHALTEPFLLTATDAGECVTDDPARGAKNSRQSGAAVGRWR